MQLDLADGPGLARAVGTRWSIDLPALPDADAPHRGDLLLAWACALGHATALRTLEDHALQPARAGLLRQGWTADQLDDALQAARMHLLIRAGTAASDDPASPPAILTYRGRGSLAAFVRTVVVRLAIDAQRRGREVPTDDLAGLVDAMHPDPALELMRRQYGDALRAAMHAAWHQLPAADRFVLGLELHERLGVDEIAAIYAIHRATALRRLASARAALVASTRSNLRHALGVDEQALDSLLRVITTAARWLPAPA